MVSTKFFKNDRFKSILVDKLNIVHKINIEDLKNVHIIGIIKTAQLIMLLPKKL